MTRLVEEFINEMLVVWGKDQTPSTREQVNEEFCRWAKQRIGTTPNPSVALVGTGHPAREKGCTRFKVWYQGKNHAIYEGGEDVMVLRSGAASSSSSAMSAGM